MRYSNIKRCDPRLRGGRPRGARKTQGNAHQEAVIPVQTGIHPKTYVPHSQEKRHIVLNPCRAKPLGPSGCFADFFLTNL